MRLPIGEGDVVCIDWDERSVRLVEASASRGGFKIRSAVQVPFTSEETARDPAELGAFIRRALGEHRIRARRALLAVPRQDTVLNLMALPKGTQDELAAMIHIQIAKELPFAKDQTVIDFAVPPGTEGPNTDVWVAAVRNQIVDYYRQVVAAAGLRPERVGLRPYANLAAVNALVEPAGRTLLVDVGPALTEIDIIREGRLAYSRAATVSIAAGEQNVPASGVMDALLVEVNRTIGAYRATDAEAKIDRIVLAGSLGIDEAMVNAFQARFNVPTQVFTVPASLKWRGASAAAAAFITTLGLALGVAADGLESFNLLAPKEPEDERRERIRRVPYKAAIMACLVAVSVAAAYVPIFQKHRELATLDRTISNLNTDKPAREELKTFEGVLKDWQAQSNCWIDQFKRLADVFPRTEKVFIVKADCRDNGEMQLELQAIDEFQAAELARTINDLKMGSARVAIHQPSNDPKYKITDHLIVQMKAPASPPAEKPRAATAPAEAETASPKPATRKNPPPASRPAKTPQGPDRMRPRERNGL